MNSPTRYDLDRAALGAMLADQPSYRLDQLWSGLYEHRLEPVDISNLPTALRSRLTEELPTALEPAAESTSENGDTVKWLWTLADGTQIETVLMHYPDRSTVCISTQAGCAMACGFCATGQAGFERHLTVGEIVEQVIRAQRRADERNRRISNVVFMGMGEPLANYDATWATVERLHGAFGLSARHLTVSTVGVVPGIKRLATAPLPVKLAVSLHAANNTLRDELVPLNKRYPIEVLVDACREYLEASGRRISFEWALIDGVNDRPSDAEELAEIAFDLHAHVNLIPLNPTPGFLAQGPPAARVAAFRDELARRGANVTVRRNRGTSIDAACGQLRANVAVAAPTRR
ncbi:MAG: 23S rRNA (adenine(2503)-C(2))-methyltransferase RlmN [Acidimicrobiales bacterium]|nr:23S rRNA (adenine(2503)-C(2))-methyltransferase RlmN [Acidimicrobiales bacterium]